MGSDGFGDVLEDVAALLAAGLGDGQQGLDESASGGALRAEAQFPPDDGVTQAPLGGVVRRFDAIDIQKRPQPVAMAVQLPAHASQTPIVAAQTAQQQALHLVAERCRNPFQAAAGDRSIAAARPLPEQLFRRPHQVVAQAFHLVVGVVDQRLPLLN